MSHGTMVNIETENEQPHSSESQSVTGESEPERSGEDGAAAASSLGKRSSISFLSALSRLHEENKLRKKKVRKTFDLKAKMATLQCDIEFAQNAATKWRRMYHECRSELEKSKGEAKRAAEDAPQQDSV